MKRNDYLYLDHAATTPMRESALEAFKNAEEFAYANSSGGHELSRRAKNLLEESRDFIASYFGAAPSEITFTSGGTEADNWVIKAPFINSKNSQNLVTSKIEHEAVSFAINLIVEDDTVTSVEFFSPVVSDETASQRTKLFFLILVAMADDTLDKDGRESVLSKLGLYDEVSTPDQLGGSLTLNKVQYIIEPLVDKGLLIGLNFYTSQLD